MAPKVLVLLRIVGRGSKRNLYHSVSALYCSHSIRKLGWAGSVASKHESFLVQCVGFFTCLPGVLGYCYDSLGGSVHVKFRVRACQPSQRCFLVPHFPGSEDSLLSRARWLLALRHFPVWVTEATSESSFCDLTLGQ